MISKNDLYDITFVLTIIRSHIQDHLNSVILTKIINVLNARDQNWGDNQIRKAVASIDGLDRKQWYLMYHNNIYANHQLI